MPDKSGPDDKKTEPRRFISEKIVKQPRKPQKITIIAVRVPFFITVFSFLKPEI